MNSIIWTRLGYTIQKNVDKKVKRIRVTLNVGDTSQCGAVRFTDIQLQAFQKLLGYNTSLANRFEITENKRTYNIIGRDDLNVVIPYDSTLTPDDNKTYAMMDIKLTPGTDAPAGSIGVRKYYGGGRYIVDTDSMAGDEIESRSSESTQYKNAIPGTYGYGSSIVIPPWDNKFKLKTDGHGKLTVQLTYRDCQLNPEGGKA